MTLFVTHKEITDLKVNYDPASPTGDEGVSVRAILKYCLRWGIDPRIVLHYGHGFKIAVRDVETLLASQRLQDDRGRYITNLEEL